MDESECTCNTNGHVCDDFCAGYHCGCLYCIWASSDYRDMRIQAADWDLCEDEQGMWSIEMQEWKDYWAEEEEEADDVRQLDLFEGAE